MVLAGKLGVLPVVLLAVLLLLLTLVLLLLQEHTHSKDLMVSCQMVASVNPSISNSCRDPSLDVWILVCGVSYADKITVGAISLHFGFGVMKCNVFLNCFLWLLHLLPANA